MKKVVINTCYGGFGLSNKAEDMLKMAKPELIDEDGDLDLWELDRSLPELVDIVETLGEEASGDYANLVVVEMPDRTTDWDIDEYDGAETLIYVVDGKINRA